MKYLISFVALCVLVNSCVFQGYSQPCEMTLKVLDMDDKPVKNRLVTAFSSMRNKICGSVTTDSNGQAVLLYDFRVEEAGGDVITVRVKDDSLFKSTNFIDGSGSGRKVSLIKKTGMFKMDSIVPFRIRFKTNRDDVKGFSIVLDNARATDKSTINNVFMNKTFLTTTPKLDTIINTMVYAKALFFMSNSMSFNNQPTFISKVSVIIPQDKRNVIFLQEF